MKEPQERFRTLEKFKAAFSGIVSAMRSEVNLRIQLVVFGIVVALGLWFQLDAMEWVAVLLVSGLVLSAEIMNTSIEKLCDVLHPNRDPGIGKVKDLSAGAVLVAALAAAAVGAIVFIPEVWQLIKTFWEK